MYPLSKAFRLCVLVNDMEFHYITLMASFFLLWFMKPQKCVVLNKLTVNLIGNFANDLQIKKLMLVNYPFSKKKVPAFKEKIFNSSLDTYLLSYE